MKVKNRKVEGMKVEDPCVLHLEITLCSVTKSCPDKSWNARISGHVENCLDNARIHSAIELCAKRQINAVLQSHPFTG